jgi:uncharacterized pyridoxamine 5'-phosphate oxidase family protein
MQKIYLNSLNAESIIEWIKQNPDIDLNFTHFNTENSWGRDAVVSKVAINTTMEQWLSKDKMYREMPELFQKRISKKGDITIYKTDVLNYFEINKCIYYCTF